MRNRRPANEKCLSGKAGFSERFGSPPAGLYGAGRPDKKKRLFRDERASKVSIWEKRKIRMPPWTGQHQININTGRTLVATKVKSAT